MPLPAYPPALIHVPARAGVGLTFPPREADPCWPADWWPRNFDTLCDDVDEPGLCFTERHLRIPPPPAVKEAA